VLQPFGKLGFATEDVVNKVCEVPSTWSALAQFETGFISSATILDTGCAKSTRSGLIPRRPCACLMLHLVDDQAVDFEGLCRHSKPSTALS
jgi:hypothetical protein